MVVGVFGHMAAKLRLPNPPRVFQVPRHNLAGS